MDTIFARVAGLDVHQKFITVAVRCRLDSGTRRVPGSRARMSKRFGVVD
jgi:hypothetical protein